MGRQKFLADASLAYCDRSAQKHKRFHVYQLTALLNLQSFDLHAAIVAVPRDNAVDRCEPIY